MDVLPTRIKKLISDSSLEKHKFINTTPFVKYLWVLRKSLVYENRANIGVKKYLCIIDVFGSDSEKAKQFILFTSPSSSNKWFPLIFFQSTNEDNDKVERDVFLRIMEKFEERLLKEEDAEEETDEDFIKNESFHCFTEHCFNFIFRMIKDYFEFRRLVLDKIYKKCICIPEFIKTLRSTYVFVNENNNALACKYEVSPERILDQIIQQM